MNIDTYRKCTNWNTGYRIDVLTLVFSIYRKPVWYSSRDVPNNNLEDVCQWLIKFTINSPFASSSSCLLSLSACHTWSHTCLDRARWSARRGRLLIHLPQAIPIPASAFNMNECLLVTSSHGIRFKNPPPPRGPQARRGVCENGSSPCRKYHCWDLQGTREAIQSGLHFLGRKRPGAPGPQDHHPRQLFSAVGRHRVPGGVLWNLRAGRSCPVSHTPPEDRTPQPTDARDSRDIITGEVGPKEKRADVQALRPRQAFRGRNPPEQGRLHRASLQAAEAVVTPHPPPALFRANYYIQRDIIFVVSWHWNKHWQ